MLPERALISFDVPGGRLLFWENDLDTWAEHLAWCYRLLGVADGATIAVQDYGTSPLAFLGSSSLMPHLQSGVAERLHGRILCLDASRERVALTPPLAEQVRLDALVVRAEVLGLLREVDERSRAGLLLRCPLLIVAIDGQAPPPSGGRRPLYLLNVESGLLLAPGCPRCRHFHLRHGFYRVAGDRVLNLRSASARPVSLPIAGRPRTGRCASGPQDCRVRLTGFGPDLKVLP
jgi:hypothetical protein